MTVTAPPMVAILKSAPPHYYESQGLDPDWAGKITVIGSRVFVHSEFGRSKSTNWVLGTSVFRIEMPHVNFDADGVVGYYSCGLPIRAEDIENWYLNRDQFTQVTRAGYNQIIVQCIHLSSFYGGPTKRSVARKALRAAYAYGITLGASLVGGDFNGTAYRTSKDSQKNVTLDDEIYNAESPMAAEEFQFLLELANKNVALSKRIGLQFRNANPLDATHYRPSKGFKDGTHCEIPMGVS